MKPEVYTVESNGRRDMLGRLKVRVLQVIDQGVTTGGTFKALKPAGEIRAYTMDGARRKVERLGRSLTA